MMSGGKSRERGIAQAFVIVDGIAARVYFEQAKGVVDGGVAKVEVAQGCSCSTQRSFG